jgi:protein-S-isoprenylcysteine O-methyltransferase Ste14
MNHEETWRIVLIAGSLILFPIAFYHRLKSQATGEKLDRRQEGPFILFTLRPMALVAALGTIAWMINPAWMAWASVALPAWLRWVGVGVGVAGGALLIWAMSSLGKNLTDTVVTRKDHTLVTSGPYRFVRHPFYDALELYLLAISLVTANWLIFLAGASLFALIVIRTRREEERLLARFGDDYRKYMEQTGRFLPGIRA